MPPAEPNPRPPSERRRFQFSLRTLMVMVAVCAVGVFLKQQYDWYRKKQILTEWIDLVLAQESSDGPQGQRPVPCPMPLTEAEQIELLEFGTANLSTSEHRTGSLKLLVERFPGEAFDSLMRMLKRPADPEFRALQLFLIGLHRNPAAADDILAFLTDDPSPVVRAGAADAIGLIHCPAYRVPLTKGGGWFGHQCTTVSSPPIDVGEIVALHAAPRKRANVRDISEHLAPDVIALPNSYREVLEHTMLGGSTDMERRASARALVTWPPSDYSLRVAEWGVWINDNGEFKLAQSIIDEIPPFVHRTGNSVDTLADRVNPMLIVSKPIVHLTVNRPLAVDVDVLIAQGRPWFAFPRPDDFNATVHIVESYDEMGERNEPSIEDFDRPDSATFVPRSEGYPQLTPSHRTHGGISGHGGDENQIRSIGLHWQSLIVSSQRTKWMSQPTIDDPARFGWWSRLREVPTSWVSSLGESERFLYYDGPTLLKSPLDVRYQDGTLEFTYAGEIPREDYFYFTSPSDRSIYIEREAERTRAGPPRRGMFIHVEHGQPRGCVLTVAAQTHSVAPAETESLEGDAVVRRFREHLAEAGLTESEATGMYDAWSRQFFRTDGCRFLLFLSKDDYDAMCPLVVRPKPTEVVRVGIVLTEF